MYRVFVRNWWKRKPGWPGGLEPDSGARKTTLARVQTECAARTLCKAYNSRHTPGPLSRKAEYLYE